MIQMSDEEDRYFSVRSAGIVKRQLIKRTCVLSGFATLVPLIFIWFPVLTTKWRGLSSNSASAARNELLKEAHNDQRVA
jgi:hypothetical protein